MEPVLAFIAKWLLYAIGAAGIVFFLGVISGAFLEFGEEQVERDAERRGL